MASNYNYTILTDVSLDVKKSQIQKQLNELSKNLGIKIDTKVDTKTTKEASDALDKVAGSSKKAGEEAAEMVISYQVANAVFRKTIDVISSLVEEIYKLDGAVTEFRKVSTLSGESLGNYVEKLGEMGTTVSKTTSEMVESATAFKKSGFSEEDSANLAVVSSMYRNIADEALSAGEASDFIISQMKAFNIEADNAIHIIDAVNQVSNTHSVSSADLANNLGKVSSALVVGNTNFEESLGLTT